MFDLIEARCDNESEAKAQLGKTLSVADSDLVCTRVLMHQEQPIAQPKPPPRIRHVEIDGIGPPEIQDPAPPPLPGKTTWTAVYEPRE